MKIGIDWGGTKIEGVVIDSDTGEEIRRIRLDSPKDDYEAILSTVVEVINNLASKSSNYTV